MNAAVAPMKPQVEAKQVPEASEAASPKHISLSSADVARIRRDFPVLHQSANGHPLVYLDNGATTQKPNCVIDAMTEFYRHDYGTVRRGVYALSARATQRFEDVREQVARFLNAQSANEIVFTRGTTEAINLVAWGYGRAFVQAGDEIIISALEHHANIVPWQQVCLEKGATLKVIPVNDDGVLDMDAYVSLLSDRTKLVAVGHVSNSLGTINPIQYIIAKAHERGVPVLVDGAQGAPHCAVDVQAWDADFYVFSGHKIYGPSGIGVLYGKMSLLSKMVPYQTGGDMIQSVSFEKTTFAPPPRRFEAGTPPIVEVIGLGEALRYVSEIGMDAIGRYEHALLVESTEKLSAIPQVRIIGTAPEKAAVVSFVIDGVHPHDIGTLLDEEGIAVRAGHHCAQPVMERYGVPATARASFSFYNTPAEIDALVAGIHKIIQVFGE
jgi:cysteine desulfurase/selenocysteine lyase